MTDLFNSDEAASAGMEKDRHYAIYVQYARGLSDHRQNQFSHFMAIHLVLLPAHAALISKSGFDSVVYSALVAFLGVSISCLSYLLIRAKFARIDATYQQIHRIEKKDMPYRFFTVLSEDLGDGKNRVRGQHYHPSIRKYELGFIWLVGLIYFSMPFIHYYKPWLKSLFGQ